MLEYFGWQEAAWSFGKGIGRAAILQAKRVSMIFHRRQMEGATLGGLGWNVFWVWKRVFCEEYVNQLLVINWKSSFYLKEKTFFFCLFGIEFFRSLFSWDGMPGLITNYYTSTTTKRKSNAQIALFQNSLVPGGGFFFFFVQKKQGPPPTLK